MQLERPVQTDDFDRVHARYLGDGFLEVLCAAELLVRDEDELQCLQTKGDRHYLVLVRAVAAIVRYRPVAVFLYLHEVDSRAFGHDLQGYDDASHQFGPEKLHFGQVYLEAILRARGVRMISVSPHCGQMKRTVPDGSCGSTSFEPLGRVYVSFIVPNVKGGFKNFVAWPLPTHME
jgi:hypothetical protein